MSPTPAGVRVWLDDDVVDRRAPAGCVHVLTASDAIRLLDGGRVVELSLDYDLGDYLACGRGIDVITFMIEQYMLHGRDLWPRDGITLHTANPVGRDAMARAIRADTARARLRVVESLSPGAKPVFRFDRR